MIVSYGTPAVIGMVFIALRKRLFGERLSTLFARLLGFSSSSLMLVTLSISWLAWLLTADSRIRKVARPPIQPVAMLLPRNGEAIKITRPISGRWRKNSSCWKYSRVFGE